MVNGGDNASEEFAIESDFLTLMPDYLEGLTLRGLAVICADLMHRRESADAGKKARHGLAPGQGHRVSCRTP